MTGGLTLMADPCRSIGEVLKGGGPNVQAKVIGLASSRGSNGARPPISETSRVSQLPL